MIVRMQDKAPRYLTAKTVIFKDLRSFPCVSYPVIWPGSGLDNCISDPDPQYLNFEWKYLGIICNFMCFFFKSINQPDDIRIGMNLSHELQLVNGSLY